MPHEGKVRAWLNRARISPEDVDDVIQEAYCNLTSLDRVDRIDRPEAYFFSIARNLLLRRLRRGSVVPLTTIAEIEAFDDDRPSPERVAAARLDLARVRRLIDALPDVSRRAVEMRKIEGRSQREIAEALSISEGMVEWHVYNGIQTVLKHMAREDAQAEQWLGDASAGQGR